MLRVDVPAFELATRGLIAFDVDVKTGERDLHSGMYGGAALNAVHVLMRCFDAVLAGPNGLLPEPLRAGITAPTAEELASWGALPPGAEELALQGARPLDPNAARAVLHPHVRGAVRRRERASSAASRACATRRSRSMPPAR